MLIRAWSADVCSSELDERAQRIERERVAGREGVTIGEPARVDRGLVAGGAEHQIGGEAEQAVAPAHRAALDRFEQEIAAPRLDQPERRGDRGLAILDRALPDERGATGGEHGARWAERRGGKGGVSTGRSGWRRC